MLQDNPRTIRKLPQRFISSEIDGELILIHGDSGEFFSLTDVGLEVWHLLDSDADLGAICEKLTESFDVAPQTCRAQVRQFAHQLVDAGFAEFG